MALGAGRRKKRRPVVLRADLQVPARSGAHQSQQCRHSTPRFGQLVAFNLEDDHQQSISTNRSEIVKMFASSREVDSNGSSVSWLKALLPIVVLSFALAGAGFATTSNASALSPGDFGFKKAKGWEKKSLKKASRGVVRKQRGWFVNKGRKVSWGIVCGRGGPAPAGRNGSTFKRKSGRWVHSPPKTSGGLQTLRGVCESSRALLPSGRAS